MPAKTVGVKLDDEIRTRIVEKCQSKSCNVSAYLKNLIKKDLAWSVDDNKARVKLDGDKILLPCTNCGHPVPFKLRDMGLARI